MASKAGCLTGCGHSTIVAPSQTPSLTVEAADACCAGAKTGPLFRLAPYFLVWEG